MVETRTVSFYSFKGGTGRSTSLTNVAYALAERGANVGCMDLDLAAPGLHMIFPEIGLAHLNSKTIHDHLHGDDSDIEDYIIDVGANLPAEHTPEGDLLLIGGDVEAPAGTDPIDMMKRSLELRDDFRTRRDLDFLLIDSRSGLSNHMIPVFDGADTFLAFHRWTHQHKQGTDKLADWVGSKGVSLDNVMSVASNVPDSVPAEDIENWVRTELYGIDEYHVINSSEILREGEEVVTMTHPDEDVAAQYRGLADKLTQM